MINKITSMMAAGSFGNVVNSWFTNENREALKKADTSHGTSFLKMYDSLSKNKELIAMSLLTSSPDILKLISKITSNKNIQKLDTILRKDGNDISSLLLLSKTLFEQAKTTNNKEEEKKD
jgi:hypothetical protein